VAGTFQIGGIRVQVDRILALTATGSLKCDDIPGLVDVEMSAAEAAK
jgi:hypothetical protein